MSDARLICPSCAKRWPQGTVYCLHCTTSLHHAKLYEAAVSSAVIATSPSLMSRPATPSQPVIPVADDALERVRANGYWVLRLRTTHMTVIGYLQLFGGVVMGFGGVVAVIVALTSQRAPAIIPTDFLAGIIGLTGYIVALVGFVLGYRLLLGSFTTFGQRDELLMRIDVAMNTAIMAAQIASLTQKSVSVTPSDKLT